MKYDSTLQELKAKIVAMLRPLSVTHAYHNIEHTFDVLDQCNRIAAAENITDVRELFLLKVAALYHDTGFLKIYKGHETESSACFLQNCAELNLSEEEKSRIISIIMATQLPQAPVGMLEKIICDADLDYLGRSDFPELSDKLRQEFIAHRVIADDQEWEQLQLHFLKDHRYHTPSSRQLREPVKQQHYERLMTS